MTNNTKKYVCVCSVCVRERPGKKREIEKKREYVYTYIAGLDRQLCVYFVCRKGVAKRFLGMCVYVCVCVCVYVCLYKWTFF